MSKVYTLAARVPFEPLPTGEYVLRLLSWEERIEDRDTQFSKRGDVKVEFKWEVSIPGSDSEERRSFAKVPASRSLKSNFYQVALALQLVDDSSALEAEAVIDLDQGIGRRCIGTIVKKLKDDNKTWTDQITAYAPYTVAGVPARRGELRGRSDNSGQRADAALDEDIPF